jgi:hypothetical protein
MSFDCLCVQLEAKFTDLGKEIAAPQLALGSQRATRSSGGNFHSRKKDEKQK